MHTARVIGIDRDDEDGTLLIRARCENCRKVVMHGGGRDLDDLQLGNRVAHCGCEDGYDLIDPHGVVTKRLRRLREEEAEFRERLALRAHRRLISAAIDERDAALRSRNHEGIRRARKALREAQNAHPSSSLPA